LNEGDVEDAQKILEHSLAMHLIGGLSAIIWSFDR